MMAAELSPSARQGQDRRGEILSAAVDVFGASGFAGARVDEVARRVGIRRPSVLYHFPDKQSLYAAALGTVMGDLSAQIIATERDSDAEGPPVGERLDAIADVWIDFVLERPNAARMLLRELTDGSPSAAANPRIGDDSPALGVLLEPALNSVRGLLGSIQSALDERVAADSLATPGPVKPLDAGEFSLILSSTSLVWVAGQTAVKGALGLDTLSAEAVARHRRTLHALIGQLVAASREANDAAPLIQSTQKAKRR